MLDGRQMAQLRKTYCRLHCCAHVAHQGSDLPAATAAAAAKGAHGVPVCTSCRLPHHNTRTDSVQRHAADLVTHVRRMAAADDVGSCDDPAAQAAGAAGLLSCPEREWQDGLDILAEALALHCRTRSANEIAAFMRAEEESGAKRLASDWRVDGNKAAAVAAAADGAAQQSGRRGGVRPHARPSVAWVPVAPLPAGSDGDGLRPSLVHGGVPPTRPRAG